MIDLELSKIELASCRNAIHLNKKNINMLKPHKIMG